MIIVNFGFVKTQKLSEGSKLAKLDSHHLKEKMNEVNKKEEKLAGSLKKLEETNMKSAVQLQKDLHNELEKVSKYFYFPESLFFFAFLHWNFIIFVKHTICAIFTTDIEM